MNKFALFIGIVLLGILLSSYFLLDYFSDNVNYYSSGEYCHDTRDPKPELVQLRQIMSQISFTYLPDGIWEAPSIKMGSGYDDTAKAPCQIEIDFSQHEIRVEIRMLAYPDSNNNNWNCYPYQNSPLAGSQCYGMLQTESGGKYAVHIAGYLSSEEMEAVAHGIVIEAPAS